MVIFFFLVTSNLLIKIKSRIAVPLLLPQFCVQKKEFREVLVLEKNESCNRFPDN